MTGYRVGLNPADPLPMPWARKSPKENSMTNVPGARAPQPVSVSKNKARGGVTGHHVRYVLAGGLTGIIVAFILIALSFGWF
jgi:hypothetical protein